MNPKWYPGYYLDPQHWPEFMPDVMEHWLPASLVRTPPANPPEPWPEPSSKPSFALFGDLLRKPRPRSLEEQLAELPTLLPDMSKLAAPKPNAGLLWGGLQPVASQPEPWPDASASSPASVTPKSPRPLFPRWPDYVMTTAGVPAKIAGWPWDVPGDVPAQPVQWPSSSASTFPSVSSAPPVQDTVETPDAEWAAIEALVNAPNPGILQRPDAKPAGQWPWIFDPITSTGLRMASETYHALTDPIPAYGDNEAMIERALPLAMLGVGGGIPFAKRGAAGVFGGRLTPGADRVALARAEEMARRSASREEILAETGWFKDGEGNWQYEISDHKARFVGPYGKQPERDLDHVIKHDDLFEAYPDLA